MTLSHVRHTARDEFTNLLYPSQVRYMNEVEILEIKGVVDDHMAVKPVNIETS